MPKINITSQPIKTGSSYPTSEAAKLGDRATVGLSKPGGLTQFGANFVTLAPSALSSLRHWHEQQDEFLVVTEGVCTLVDDHGDTDLHPGECAAFPAGDPNGHHIVNKSDAPAAFVVVGTHTPTEVAHYSDVDMKVTIDNGTYDFTHKDGTPYSGEKND